MSKSFVLRCGLALVAFALAGNALPTQADSRRHSITGKIVEIPQFRSEILNNRRGIHVWLPEGYDAEHDRYPVLYMQDGQNCFDGFTSFIPNQEWQADETATALIGAGLIPKMIIVAIDNSGPTRADEYLPTKVVRDAKTGESWGGRANQYIEFLTKELKPYIDKNYRTKPGFESTGICGSSFGAILTLHAGLEHPNVFSKLAIVSPSVWWDDREIIKEVSNRVFNNKQKIWMDMGSAEGETSLPDAELLAKTVLERNKGIGSRFAFYVHPGAQHSEVAWSQRFGMILMFLYGKN